MEPVARLQNAHSKSAYSTRVSGAFGLPTMWSRSGSTARSRVAPTATGGLIRSVTVNISQPSTKATSEATSTPTRARSWLTGSVMAMSTMNSEMVNPIPDSAAPPATRRSVRPGASAPRPVARTIAVAAVMPTNLPTTSRR